MGLKFLFELVDRTSGPARAMGGQMTALDRQMQKLDRRAKSLRDSFAAATRTPAQNRALAQLDRAASLRETMAQMERLRGQTGSTATGFRELAAGAGGWIAVATTVAAVSGVAAMELGRLGVEFGRTAVDATAFQQSTMTQLETLLGSEGAATRGFSFAQTVARQTPLDSRQVFGSLSEATAGGFRGQWAEDMIAASADVGALNPTDAGASSRFLLQMGQMFQSAKISMADLRPAAQAARLAPNEVYNRAAVYAGMRQRRGESDAAWQTRRDAAVHSGRITGQMGVRGLEDAMMARTGGRQLGSIARDQSQTLTGVLSNLRSTTFDLLQSLNLSKIPGMVAFRRFLVGLAGVLSPSTAQGKRLASVLGSLIDLLFGTLFGGDASAGIEGTFSRMLDFLEAMIGVGRFLSPVLRALFGGILEGAGAALGPLVSAFSMLFGGKTDKGASRLADAIRWIGRVVGFVFVALVVGTAAVMATFALVAAAFGVLFVGPIVAAIALVWLAWKSLTAIVKGAPAVGRAMAEGLAAGIRSGISGIIDAATAAATAVTSTVRNVLKIRSPSRVMMQLGGFADEGFARGVEGGRSARAMGDVVEPPSGRRLSAMGGGGINLTIVVERGDSDPEDIGERAARRAIELITDWTEMQALSGTV